MTSSPIGPPQLIRLFLQACVAGNTRTAVFGTPKYMFIAGPLSLQVLKKRADHVKMSIMLETGALQLGHFWHPTEQISHICKCLQGRKSTVLALSQHTTHNVFSVSPVLSGFTTAPGFPLLLLPPPPFPPPLVPPSAESRNAVDRSSR